MIKKTFFYLLLLTVLFQSTLLAVQYSKVRIVFRDRDQQRTTARAGVIIDHGAFEKLPGGRIAVTAVLNDRELSVLNRNGISYQVLVPDVVAAYQQRAKATPTEIRAMNAADQLQHFELGSMGGYYTYDEVVAELDSMHLLYPQITTTKQSIGKSIEGRDLWMLKISDNPDEDEDEPEIFYNALHHAREPAGMMAVMYFMDYLLENYGSDPEVTYLVDHRELYFIPVINPDGYVYNQQTNPDGGGQWRKNRRENPGNFYGVDLNRNYGYEWGHDDEGSSPYPYSGTYRGTEPFSEPETQAVRDFCNSRQFVIALSYHTYSDRLIYPWGYESTLLTPDSVIFFDHSARLTADNHYLTGTANQTVGYIVNGDSDDWFYGEQDSKGKIIAMTPEVGTDEDGFWPAEDRIYPLCRENLPANLLLAWLGGGKAVRHDFRVWDDDLQNEYVDAGETGAIVFDVMNVGLNTAQNVSFSLLSSDPYIQIVDGQQQNAVAIPSRATVTSDTFRFSVDATAPGGYAPELVLAIDQDGVTKYDTLRTFFTGTPQILFADSAESGLDQWTVTGSWDTTGADYTSGARSFTDSPHSHYADNQESLLTLRNPLDLPAANRVTLTFNTKWRIENNYDFATVEISTDSANWTALSGQLTADGSGKGQQPSGTPGYDGLQMDWTGEVMDLSDYAGQQIWLRFRLTSDDNTNMDGWYLDDMRVQAYEDQPSGLAHTKETVPE
ncbi:MAG TPA: zinc carboxypeptidase, partial [Caldithrix abyssi]|nr:zinc carboxypeptidase [Caldithrix abyssi]